MHKCTFAHCLFGDHADIPEGTEVKVGRSFYHPECAKVKENIRQITDLFVEHINPNVIFPQLTRAINNIVFEKGIDSELLLFGLQYYIDHKIPLQYPGGLYYVVQCREMLKEYWKMVNNREIARMQAENPDALVISGEVVKFTWAPAKQKTIEDLLGE